VGVRHKIIIATALLFAGILLFGAFAIVPLLGGIKKDSENLEAQYVKVFKAILAETEATEFLKVFKAQEQDFEKIGNLFVDAETPIGFIQFIEEIATVSNLKVKIAPGAVKKQKKVPWPVMDFQLASSGRYPQFLRFLEKLENGPYLLLVKNTSLARESAFAGEENVSQDMSFTLLLEVFTGPLPEAL